MDPTSINDVLVEAGITGPARPALLAISSLLTSGNPLFRWPGTSASQGDVAGMFQVMSKFHGNIPDSAVNQSLQALEIYTDLAERGLVNHTPAEEVTADSLARTISTWRMPSSFDKPKSETEHARWLPQAKKLLADNPELFGRADDPAITKKVKLWVPIAIAAVVGLITLIVVFARK